VRARHKIRISAKKLRYANEFFASIFVGRKAKKQRRVLAKSLKRLQSSLGDLNDFALHGRLGGRLARARPIRTRGRRARRRAFAAGTIAGRERAQVRPLLKSARRALGDIAAAKAILAEVTSDPQRLFPRLPWLPAYAAPAF